MKYRRAALARHADAALPALRSPAAARQAFVLQVQPQPRQAGAATVAIGCRHRDYWAVATRRRRTVRRELDSCPEGVLVQFATGVAPAGGRPERPAVGAAAGHQKWTRTAPRPGQRASRRPRQRQQHRCVVSSRSRSQNQRRASFPALDGAVNTLNTAAEGRKLPHERLAASLSASRPPGLVVARRSRAPALRQRRAGRSMGARRAGEIGPVRLPPWPRSDLLQRRRHIDGVV